VQRVIDDALNAATEDFKEDLHMANTAIIGYTTKPDAADENQRVVEQDFAELVEKVPDGLRATPMTCHSFNVEDIDGR
jgi:hypothetical protein